MNIINVIESLHLKIVSPRRRAEMLKKRIGGGIKIGNDCEIHGNVNFGSEPYLIELGDKVRITKGVTFVTHDGGMWVLRNNGMLRNADLFGEIKIGSNVHIGINSIIMPDVTIGDNVIIGVNSVVTKNISSNSVAVGVPARVIKTIDEYHEKYKDIVDNTKCLTVQEKRKYLSKKYKLFTL